jgi:hypothetical protein
MEAQQENTGLPGTKQKQQHNAKDKIGGHGAVQSAQGKIRYGKKNVTKNGYNYPPANGMQGREKTGKKQHDNNGKNDRKNYQNKEQAGTCQNMGYQYHNTGHHTGKIHNIVQADFKWKVIVVKEPV